MSVVLRASVRADIERRRAWATLTDWAGQARWIPFTTVRVTSQRAVGLGVRADAFSGFRPFGLPVGLTDHFIVTGWTPPRELEVLHLGPFFTGEGVFSLSEASGAGTVISCAEVFAVPGGAPVQAALRLAVPALRLGLQRSLQTLADLLEKVAP